MGLRKRSNYIIFVRELGLLFLILILFLLEINVAYSAFTGPTVTPISNSTRVMATNATVNGTAAGTTQAGGYIFTMNLNGLEQNTRWKAYVGNVTGSLTLDDANSFTIYSWDTGTVTGEIYATRNNSVVNWSNINCSYVATRNKSGFSSATNRTLENLENTALSHTKLDNITATFSNQSHPQLTVGSINIPANSCYSIYPYVNDSAQSGQGYFTEVLLTDSDNVSNDQSILYAGIIEDNRWGYSNAGATNLTYDFELVIPENGAASWTSSTLYYFYVELN